MALSVPTLLTAAAGSSTATSWTSAAVAPTGGGLLTVTVGLSTGSAITVSGASVSDTFAGTGAWSVHETESLSNASGSAACVVATALAGPTPGTGAVTVSWIGSMSRRLGTVSEVTGQHATPVVQSQSAQGSGGGTLTVTLDSPPAADSLVIGAIGIHSSTGTTASEGANFTELSAASSGSSPAVNHEVMYDKDSADTTADWTLALGRYCGVAIEIAAAAEVAPARRAIMYARRRGR